MHLLKYIIIGDDIMLKVQLRLEQTLEELKINRYELAKRTNIRYHIIDNYYKNKVVRYDSYVLSRICSALDCKISDILETIEE